MLFKVLLFIFQVTSILSNLNVDQCTKESCSSLTPTTFYLLYDINPGEGFNLRRDVYVRMANLVRQLREHSSSDKNWILVLPPWGPLYHWFSYDLQRTKLGWDSFFDISSLSRFVPVIEFEQFIQLSSSNLVTISYVYTLQHFSEGWGENFEEKIEPRSCNDKALYEKRQDNYYHGWFFGYGEMVRAKNFQCLSAQGFVTVLIDHLLQNITWPNENEDSTMIKSIMFDRAETLLHKDYGGVDYWRARRSMRYARRLIHLGNHFRSDFLNSTDIHDRTVLIDDWTKMKRHHGQALGGPYLSVHLRRRDYVRARPKQVPSLTHAARQICHHLSRLNLSVVFVSTDADDHEVNDLRKSAHTICQLSNDQFQIYRPDTKVLEKILDGGKAIVDQWICAHARYFVGSYESTFSFRIQEDREILGFDKESTFNRLCGDDEGVSCEKPSIWPIVY